MYKVDLWVWTDSRSPKEDLKAYAYSIEMRRPSGEIYRKTGEDNISGTWNKATLTAIANALERFSANAEVTIHTENRWVMNMMEHNLMVWEARTSTRIRKRRSRTKRSGDGSRKQGTV